MASTINGRVEGTREEILGILRRRSGVTVEQLATELGLAGATVRRHLDVLLRDDYVSVTQERGGAGRPRYRFSLTELGADLFPHHYVRLTRRLLDEIVALDAEETSGRDGEQIAAVVFEKMADRLAAEYAPRVTGGTLEERVRSAVELIAEEGLDFDLEAGEDGVRLLGRGCPCSRIRGLSVGDGNGLACDHDRRMLERVTGATVVPLDPSEIPNDFLCGYQITE